MKKLIRSLLLVACLSFGLAATRAADTAPKSVIHVITVAWKADAKPEQIKAALDGVKQLPADFKGITRVWTNAIKIQDAPGARIPKKAVIVMEFVDEQALKDYAGSDAQKKWYALYEDIREQSTTFDITN